MPRFVLLEHTGHPDDPAGLHYDLLLEDRALAGGPACRTWRLVEIPQAGSGPVAAQELPPHRLEWLEREEGPVSGNRGFARRIDAGTYEPIATPLAAAAEHRIRLQGGLISGDLAIAPTPVGLHAWLEAMIPRP
jgi:hypothetical protein